MEPEVSVVIPTYNRGQSVCKAIESVLAQTFDRYEIVVVDDGSTDDTRDRVSRYGGAVRYVHKTNGGVASARNEGLRHARGRYVAWLDSDDEWLPFKLELQMRVLRQRPNVSIVFSDFSGVDDEGDLTYSYAARYFGNYGRFGGSLSGIFEHQESLPLCVNVHGRELSEVTVHRGNLYDAMIWGNLILTSTTVLDRRLVDQFGFFDESLAVYEDYEFHLRLCRNATVAFVDVPTTVYQHAASDRLTHDGALAPRILRRKTLLRILERIAANDPELARCQPNWWPGCAGQCHAKLSHYLAIQDRALARRHWRQALSLNPRAALSPKTAARVWLPKPLVRGLEVVKRGLTANGAA